MREVSVVVPSYNSHGTIGKTLEHLLSQEEGAAKEIVVVDSSDDGRTPGVLEAFEKRGVRVLRLAEKTFPGKARNLGAARCTGDILAFIDSDAYPAPDWVGRIARAVEGGTRVGGGSVKIPDFQKNDTLSLAQYFLQFNEFLESGPRRVKTFVPSVNLFCEKALFDEVGGFPPVRASEDVLFGIDAGARSPVWFDPSIRIYHIFRQSHRDYHRNQRMLGRHILLYRRMHYNSFLYRGLLPALLLPAFVLLKSVRIAWRILSMGKAGETLRFLYALPYFMAGLWFWTAGFWSACFEKEGTVA